MIADYLIPESWSPRERRLAQAILDMGVMTTYDACSVVVACPHVLCKAALLLLAEGVSRG